MTETRPWPAYVAVVALVGLLVAAYVVGRSGTQPMWITPQQAEPGSRVVVHYEKPRELAQLTVRRAGVTYYVTDSGWTELEDGAYATLTSLDGGTRTSEVTIPGDAAPGHYLLCSDGYEPVADDSIVEESGGVGAELVAAEVTLEQLCAGLDVTSP